MERGNYLGLSASGRSLLERLRVAREPEELVRAGVSPKLLDALLVHGFLEPQDDTSPPIELQDVFGAWKSHRGMLVDSTRTEAFRRAIAEVVKPGDRVIDVGTGSGILAMFAAQAGAGEVTGLEVTAMADWAEHLATVNGLDAVRIVRGDAAGYQAEAPVDLVMGEFIGLAFLDEWRHMAAFAAVRDRNLRPGGTVLPRGARLLLSAIDSRRLYVTLGYGFWEAPAYGLDFSDVREADIAAPARYVVTADEADVVATEEIAAFDFLTVTAQDCFFTSEIVFRYPVGGSFHGVLAHFELDMAPGQVLAMGPAHRETCWHHSYLPMPALQVPAGGEVTIRTRSFLDPETGTLCLGLTAAGPGDRIDAESREHVFPLE